METGMDCYTLTQAIIMMQGCTLWLPNIKNYFIKECFYLHLISHVFRAGMKLLKFFEKRCKDLNLNYNEDEVRQPNAKMQKLERNGNQNGVEHSEEDDDDSNHS